MFTSSELWRILRRLRDGRRLVEELRRDAPVATLAAEAADLLERRNRVDREFFAAIAKMAGDKRRDDVVAVAALWEVRGIGTDFAEGHSTSGPSTAATVPSRPPDAHRDASDKRDTALAELLARFSRKQLQALVRSLTDGRMFVQALGLQRSSESMANAIVDVLTPRGRLNLEFFEALLALAGVDGREEVLAVAALWDVGGLDDVRNRESTTSGKAPRAPIPPEVIGIGPNTKGRPTDAQDGGERFDLGNQPKSPAGVTDRVLYVATEQQYSFIAPDIVDYLKQEGVHLARPRRVNVEGGHGAHPAITPFVPEVPAVLVVVFDADGTGEDYVAWKCNAVKQQLPELPPDCHVELIAAEPRVARWWDTPEPPKPGSTNWHGVAARHPEVARLLQAFGSTVRHAAQEDAVGQVESTEALSRRVLNAAVEMRMLEGDRVPLASLERRFLKSGAGAFERALDELVPDRLEPPWLPSLHLDYLPTLLGIVESAHGPWTTRVLDDLLALIRARFSAEDFDPVFSWNDLAEAIDLSETDRLRFDVILQASNLADSRTVERGVGGLLRFRPTRRTSLLRCESTTELLEALSVLQSSGVEAEAQPDVGGSPHGRTGGRSAPTPDSSLSPATLSDAQPKSEFHFDVFLSHASEDKTAVRSFATRLRAAGLTVWLDEERMPAGFDPREAIARGLKESRHIAVWVSDAWLAKGKKWTRWELQCFEDAEADDRRVLPILLRKPDDALLGPYLANWTRVPPGLGDDERLWLTVCGVRAVGPDERVLWAQKGAELAAGAGELPQERVPADAVSTRLEAAYEERAGLDAEGKDLAEINKRILELQREQRRGPTLEVGDHLGDGRYRLVERLGRGGFATVWKAQERLGGGRTRWVALKVLHGDLTHERSRVERFRRGARAMASLDHPAIVRVYDAEGEDDGYRYFAMEYLAGGNLRQAVVSRAVDVETSLRLLIGIADGLQHAHENGLVHRDVKPQNILLDGVAGAKLTDFDLVRSADSTGGTRTGALGTFLYVAPEQGRDASRVDHRADVYGLGMTAVFCVHGAPLPDDVIYDRRAFLGALACEASIRDVLGRAVARSLEVRFATMSQLRQALLTAIQAPVDVVNDSVAGAGRRPERFDSVSAVGEALVGHGTDSDGTHDPSPAPLEGQVADARGQPGAAGPPDQTAGPRRLRTADTAESGSGAQTERSRRGRRIAGVGPSLLTAGALLILVALALSTQLLMSTRPVSIRVDPFATSVRLDGKDLGSGEMFLARMRPNQEYTLEAVHPNFRTLKETISIEPTTTELEVRLEQTAPMDFEPREAQRRSSVPQAEASRVFSDRSRAIDDCLRRVVLADEVLTGAIRIHVDAGGYPIGMETQGKHTDDPGVRQCLLRQAAALVFSPLQNGDYATIRYEYTVTATPLERAMRLLEP